MKNGTHFGIARQEQDGGRKNHAAFGVTMVIALLLGIIVLILLNVL